MRFTCIVILLFLGYSATSQKASEKQVETYLENGRFLDAFEVLKGIDKKDAKIYFWKGVVSYHTNKLEDALLLFSLAYDKGYEESELLKYIAKTHHRNEEYAEAARAYKLYLNEIDRDDPSRNAIIKAIKQCGFAMKVMTLPSEGFSENMGDVVNSPYDDYAPIHSPNHPGKYYFSSNRIGSTGGLRGKDGKKNELTGSYSADIYAVELTDGNWVPAPGIPSLINSPKNDIIMGFTDGGNVLIIKQVRNENDAIILIDTFGQEASTSMQEFIAPINPKLGDKDLFFFNDSTLLFASKRKGGYGGYDIYATTSKNGIWQEPENLGPEINGPFNECSPFLAKSGSELYYSSNREQAIGGYDVYRAFYGMEKQNWSTPEHLSQPISSPGDDLYYRLSPDGRSSIVSSDRKQSTGGMDLFIIYLKKQNLNQLAFVEKAPFLDNYEDLSGISSNEDMAKLPSIEEKGKVNLKNRELVLPPLFYNENQSITTPANLQVLDDLVDFMKIYPETKVEFTGFTTNDGSKAYNLYFSIKRAENASSYLVRNGIEPSRISLKGVGDNYPIAKNINSNLAIKSNRRVDIKLTGEEEKGLIISYTPIKVADYLKASEFPEYLEKKEGLYYSIAVNKARQMYDHPYVMLQSDLSVEKEGEAEMYTYKLGLFPDYFSARNEKNNLIRNGILNAEIKVYLNGVEIKKDAVSDMEESYPDLGDFIKYEVDK